MMVRSFSGFSSARDALLFAVIFGGTFALVGLVFLCVGIGFAVAEKKRESLCTAYADGEVKALERRQGSMALLPVFSFRVGEQTLVRPSRVSSTSTRYIEGQSVRVRYDPQNPNTFLVEGEPRITRVFVYVFGGIGVLFLGIAAITAILTLV